jgi:G3E family GTPase
MAKVTIACIGGFLGAGKTTAMRAAALELVRRGLKVCLITNDQGSGLVDTKSIENLKLPTREISGGCFCCKFDDLVAEAEQLLDQERPNIILAEAVGSCTDLSATVYQPLRKYYSNQFDLAPLTILVEPDRIRALVDDDSNGFPDTVRYLFQKQLAEADLILLNKIDAIGPPEAEALAQRLASFTPDIPVRFMSALTGERVSEWVDFLLNNRTAGEHILDIDYDLYAQAEAALGWLNATVEVTAPHDFSPRDLAGSLMRRMQRTVVEAGMNIAHLKILVATETETDHIALTTNRGRPRWSGGEDFPNVRELSLMINARIHASPQALTQVTQDSLAASEIDFGVTTKVQHLESFSPLPPKPRYRMSEKTP